MTDESPSVDPTSANPTSADPTPTGRSDSTSADAAWVPMGPGFLPTFLYYFSGTALVTTFLASKTLGLSISTGIPNQFGLLVGLFGGLLGAYFNQSQQLEVPFTSRKVFLAQLEPLLAERGYRYNPDANLEEIRVYQRPAVRQLFSGKIYVYLDENKAILSSRAVHLRSLKQSLLSNNG